MNDLTIVVASYETSALLIRCLDRAAEALDAYPDLQVETIVVDNGSRDGSVHAAMSSKLAPRVIALARNRGFAAGCNHALRLARSRHVLLLNSDAEIEPDVLDRAVRLLDGTPEMGILGIALRHEDGRPQRSVHAIPDLQSEILPEPILKLIRPKGFQSGQTRQLRHRKRGAGAAAELREVEAVRGAVFFIRGELLEKIGSLDESYFFFLEETDFCWRAKKAGYRVFHFDGTWATHLLGASSKRHAALATRIEFHRSLYRFLENRSGLAVANVSRLLRAFRTGISLIGLSILAAGSSSARRQWAERWGLFMWHLRGCPNQPSFAQCLGAEILLTEGRPIQIPARSRPNCKGGWRER